MCEGQRASMEQVLLPPLYGFQASSSGCYSSRHLYYPLNRLCQSTGFVLPQASFHLLRNWVITVTGRKLRRNISDSCRRRGIKSEQRLDVAAASNPSPWAKAGQGHSCVPPWSPSTALTLLPWYTEPHPAQFPNQPTPGALSAASPFGGPQRGAVKGQGGGRQC